MRTGLMTAPGIHGWSIRPYVNRVSSAVIPAAAADWSAGGPSSPARRPAWAKGTLKGAAYLQEGGAGMQRKRAGERFGRCQSRGRSGASVGRRSSVSSSSARWASLASDHPSARAMRSATSHVGFAVPRSIPRMVLSSTVAASARASWLSPLSRRRRPMARPRAACGVGLGRTLEDSAWTARMNRKYVSGYDLAPMGNYSISRSSSAGVVPRASQPQEGARRRVGVRILELVEKRQVNTAALGELDL